MPFTNDIHHKILGEKDTPVIIWAHGWGLSHASLLQLAQSFEHNARHILIDFHGFGESPAPADIWGAKEYADALAAFIQDITDQPVIWIGHSFGGRVGIQISATYPELIKGLGLIASAGLPVQRPAHKELSHKIQVHTFKTLKKLVPLGLVDEDWLKSKFGSPDYRNADPVMRNILVKVVNENLGDAAKKIQCPTQLIYGAQDSETPPKLGERLEHLIPKANLKVLEGLDHYSILAEGRHQVTPIIKQFIKSLDD